MGLLFLFNVITILIITALLILVKRKLRSERAKRWTLLVAPIVTIVFHYSKYIYLAITGGDAFSYLCDNLNLVLPIYPCNVVMWCALIYGLLPNKDGKMGRFLGDYIFWFGIVSTAVGMFANVDFIMNPTLRDFEVTKSILAHATLLFNVLLIPVFGKLQVSFFQNMRSMILSVIGMYAIGLYCNLVLKVLVSVERAYDVNSMFIIHSPFGPSFLRYPVIATLALVLYFIVFTICDLIKNPKGHRWFNRKGVFL